MQNDFMKYTFNSCVTFDVAERKLSSDDAAFVLTNPACRLLLVLIENNGELVEKECLLVKVWEDFGLASSEGSLYNNISLLRKGLVHVGITNRLETVPKKGVRLTLDSIDLENLTTDEVVSNQILTPLPSFVEKRGGWLRWKKYFLLLISAMLILSIMALLINNYVSKKHQNYRYFGNVDKCVIYYFDDVNVEMVRSFFSNKQGENILKLCNVPALIYYDDNNFDVNDNQGASIVSFCDLQEGNVHECKNFVNVTVN